MLQNGVCAICGKLETALFKPGGSIRALSVDHNHRTNKVRGLLCGHCNSSVGHLEKIGIVNLYKIVDYLQEGGIKASAIDEDAVLRINET